MTTSAQRRSFLGVPVEGSITKSRNTLHQRTLEEFQEIVRAVLDDPEIADFGWQQYTPYFNDGEECTFGANGFWIRTKQDVATLEAGKDYDPDDDDWIHEETFTMWRHPSLGQVMTKWDHEVKVGAAAVGDYLGPDRARYDRCVELEHAVEGGEFEDVLYELFGDHANVRVCKDRIVVEEYHHD